MADIKMKSDFSKKVNNKITKASISLKSIEHWKVDNVMIPEAYISVIQEAQRWLTLAENEILQSIYKCNSCLWKGGYTELKPLKTKCGITQEIVCPNCNNKSLKV